MKWRRTVAPAGVVVVVPSGLVTVLDGVGAEAEGDLAEAQRVDVRAARDPEAVRRQVARDDVEFLRGGGLELVPREGEADVGDELSDRPVLADLPDLILCRGRARDPQEND